MATENLENLKERSQESIIIDLTQDSTNLIQEIPPLIITNKIVPPPKKDPSKFFVLKYISLLAFIFEFTLIIQLFLISLCYFIMF